MNNISIQCECGCGESFPQNQIVIRTVKAQNTKEFLYICHCIDAYQLFTAPQKLRDKLNESGITTHLYALPGEPLRDWILIEQNKFRFVNYVRCEDPVYGTYFVWELDIPDAKSGFTFLNSEYFGSKSV